MTKKLISLNVNGERSEIAVEPSWTLLETVREQLRLTGTKEGCGTGDCGACSMIVDGRLITSCLMLAVQADGRRVDTIEGLSDSGELAALQEAFHRRNALQCGFCTPGMLIAAQDLVANEPGASRERIREHLSGNYCRCTGYQAIVDAIEDVLRK